MKYVLTENGIKYLTRVNGQIINMNLLRVEVSENYSDTPELLTQIANKKQGFQIDEISIETDVATIHCTLTNLEVHDEYILRQIGVIAWDSDRNREELIIVGQDEEGDRIPAIEEREVQYLYNIGVKVSNAKNITFDSDTNDFLRKKYFYSFVKEMEKRERVTIGTEDKLLEEDEICFIADEIPWFEEPVTIIGAGITNMMVGTESPVRGENFGMVTIVEGKLTVSALPDDDTTYFAQI